jgi:hyperosmotically inducible protein
MKTLSRAIRVFLVTGLLVMAGIAFGAPGASAGTVVDPSVSAIENQVQHKLTMLPWFGVFDNLQYQVNGTEVILSGQVVSEHDRTKYDAENEVKRISGVTNVVNNIEVLPLSTFDNQTRRAEYRAIFSNSNLGRYSMGAIPQLHIIVNNGHVTLEGVVMNQMDRDIAGIVANTVPGVFSVTNNLQIG